MDVVINGIRYTPVDNVAKAVEAGCARVNLVKATEERRYTLGVAYPAMKADVTVAADGHIDFASEAVVEQAAWSWMSKHREIGLGHRKGTEGRGDVVESYIYRGPDWVITSPVDGQDYVVKAGDWLLGVVWREDTWSLVKSGLINGFSPQGGARRRAPSAEQLARLR